MRSIFRQDAVKVLLYLFGAVALGYALLPWIERLGSALQEIVAGKQTNYALRQLSDWSQRTTWVGIFRSSIVFSALLLLPALLGHLGGQPERYFVNKRPWQLFLAAHRREFADGKQMGWWRFLRHGLFAAAIVCVLLLLLTVIVQRAGPLTSPVAAGSGLVGSLAVMILTVVLGEWLLRGILLGIFLRSFRPPIAIVCVAFVGSLGYFFQTPVNWVDPQDISYEAIAPMMVAMLHHAMEPQRLLGIFLPLLVWGILLGVVRYRTGSVAGSIGCQAGLCLYLVLSVWGAHAPIAIGAMVKDAPLLLLGLIGFVVALIVGFFGMNPRQPHEEW